MDTAVKFLVLTVLVVTIGFAVVREGLNYLEHPSLQVIRYPNEGRELLLYHKGVTARHATVFVRALGPRDQAVRIGILNYEELREDGTLSPSGSTEPPFGELRWTADATAVVATRRPTRIDPELRPLWIFDIGSQTRFAPGEIAGGQLLGPGHLEAILRVKGGLGHTVASWFELGKRENYVFSWKAHHWDRLSAVGEGRRP